MRLDLDSLKTLLHLFAGECNLTIQEIGILADESSSADDFKNKLDTLCYDKTGKTSLEILAGIGVRLPATVNSQKASNPSENSPLQNELVEVQKKIENLNERDKSRLNESKF